VATHVCHIVLPSPIHSHVSNHTFIQRIHICSHVPLCSYLGIINTECTLIVLAIFRTDCCPHVLNICGKNDEHGDKDPKDERK